MLETLLQNHWKDGSQGESALSRPISASGEWILKLQHGSASQRLGGEGVKVEDHLQDMRRRRMAPTVRSYNTVIHACAKVGASAAAERYLLEMRLGRNVNGLTMDELNLTINNRDLIWFNGILWRSHYQTW